MKWFSTCFPGALSLTYGKEERNIFIVAEGDQAQCVTKVLHTDVPDDKDKEPRAVPDDNGKDDK